MRLVHSAIIAIEMGLIAKFPKKQQSYAILGMVSLFKLMGNE